MTEIKIQKIDKKLFDIKKKLDYINYFNPTNFNKEKKLFFDNFHKGVIYNPQFKYKKLSDKQYTSIKEKIKSIDIDDSIDDDFKKIFKFYLEDLENRLELIHNIGNDNKIFQSAQKVFGPTNKNDFDLSIKKVKRTGTLFPEVCNDEKILKRDLIEKTKKVLMENGIKWEIKFKKDGALGSVDFNNHIIYYKDLKEGYSDNFSDILIFHEILGHVVQSANAEDIELKIFKTGFGYYEDIHEGWALINEERVNPMLKNRIYLYYIATYIAERNSFYKTFLFMLQFLDMENAYTVTSRVKRGLSDTGKNGSFMKDKAYFEGYFRVKNMPYNEIKLIKQAIFDYRFKKEVRNIYKENDLLP